jgi:hypothetical protein
MTEKYKFKDRTWDVKHKDGRHIDTVSVSADDVRQFHKDDPSLKPSTHEAELLNNAVSRTLFNHKLKPLDIEVIEKEDKPKPITHKATGGKVCW